MGNSVSRMGNYLGYGNSSHSVQLLQNQVQELKNQMDRDRDNKVSKEELYSYLDQLANKIDQNSDGVITQSELESYVSTQLQDSHNEIERWKREYEILETKYDTLLGSVRQNQTESEIVKSNISTAALKNYIEEQVMQTDANIKMIPDPLERRVYLTVYKTIMKSMEDLFNTTSVDLLNHRISFSIQPIPSDKSEKD